MDLIKLLNTVDSLVQIVFNLLNLIIFSICFVGGLSIGLLLKFKKRLNKDKIIRKINKKFLFLKPDFPISAVIQIIIKGRIKIIYFGEITEAPITEQSIVRKYEDKIINIIKLLLLLSEKILTKFLIRRNANSIKKIPPKNIEPKKDLK